MTRFRCREAGARELEIMGKGGEEIRAECEKRLQRLGRFKLQDPTRSSPQQSFGLFAGRIAKSAKLFRALIEGMAKIEQTSRNKS